MCQNTLGDKDLSNSDYNIEGTSWNYILKWQIGWFKTWIVEIYLQKKRTAHEQSDVLPP